MGSANPQAPLPAPLQFVAGGIAGVTEILVMYPLDGFFMYHISSRKDKISTASGKKLRCKEGPGSLYRGILAPVLVEAPKRATKFGANELFGRIYRDTFGVQPSRMLSVATGISAGISEAFLIVSFELVKIQMQDKANATVYKNSFDVVRRIYAADGIKGFFKGLEATMWRHAAWNGAYFGLIATIRQAMPEAKTPQGTTLTSFVAGSIGGFIATTINTPFDVVKSRIQGQKPGASDVKYRWTFPSLRSIIAEEGFSALYKGYVPKVLRLGPGGGILLVVYDKVTAWMHTAFYRTRRDE